MLQELQLYGILPNVITSIAVISAFERAKKPLQRLHLVQEMEIGDLAPDRSPWYPATLSVDCVWSWSDTVGSLREGGLFVGSNKNDLGK